jgi:hypothetical protein
MRPQRGLLSALGEDGGDDRERSRGGGRRSKPLEGARDHQHLLGDREAATKGSRREDGKPHDEGPPPAPQVRHPPRQEQEARKEQHVSRDHPLQTHLQEPQILPDRMQSHYYRVHVQHVHELRHTQQNQRRILALDPSVASYIHDAPPYLDFNDILLTLK